MLCYISVKDGNHRVSVTRQRGQELIDAYVIEVSAPVPIASAGALEAWLRNGEPPYRLPMCDEGRQHV
jgi:hypothetical protein